MRAVEKYLDEAIHPIPGDRADRFVLHCLYKRDDHRTRKIWTSPSYHAKQLHVGLHLFSSRHIYQSITSQILFVVFDVHPLHHIQM